MGRNGQTALHVAALHGHTEVVKATLNEKKIAMHDEIHKKTQNQLVFFVFCLGGVGDGGVLVFLGFLFLYRFVLFRQIVLNCTF